MSAPNMSQCQAEGKELYDYYKAMGLPEPMAVRLASEYIMRRLLFRQDSVLEGVSDDS